MSFERKLYLGLNSKERHFLTETQFVRRTDEFQKNVIRSNDLPRLEEPTTTTIDHTDLGRSKIVLPRD
jgi:hypothetical protein